MPHRSLITTVSRTLSMEFDLKQFRSHWNRLFRIRLWALSTHIVFDFRVLCDKLTEIFPIGIYTGWFGWIGIYILDTIWAVPFICVTSYTYVFTSKMIFSSQGRNIHSLHFKLLIVFFKKNFSGQKVNVHTYVNHYLWLINLRFPAFRVTKYLVVKTYLKCQIYTFSTPPLYWCH